MYYICPFHELFPEQAWRECRVMHVLRGDDPPAGEYALLESYCIDPNCDCRRVMLNVLPRSGTGFLATIGLGFDRDDEMAGPYLDPLNPQSAHAPAFLELIRTVVLADPAYVARLESHYRQVKAAVARPTPAVRQVMHRYAMAGTALQEGSPRKTGKRPGKGRPGRRPGGRSNRAGADRGNQNAL